MSHLDLLELDPDLEELLSAAAAEAIPGRRVRLVTMAKDESPTSDEREGEYVDYRSQSTRSS